jgi:hypothetical protein
MAEFSVKPMVVPRFVLLHCKFSSSGESFALAGEEGGGVDVNERKNCRHRRFLIFDF